MRNSVSNTLAGNVFATDAATPLDAYPAALAGAFGVLSALAFLLLAAAILIFSQRRKDPRAGAMLLLLGGAIALESLVRLLDAMGIWPAHGESLSLLRLTIAALALFAAYRIWSAAPRETGDALSALSRELQKERDERARITLLLAKARQETDAANRSKNDFLHRMSHELRTPLNAILGFSEVISAGLLEPSGKTKYAEYVRDIHRSGEHLLDIVNELLDVARIEEGKMKLRETPLDAGALVADAARALTPRARDAGISLVTAIDPALPAILADHRMVKQMVMNLATNAIKFTAAGGVVRISARRRASGEFELSVADDGIGIRAEELPRALEVFGQANLHHPRAGEGFGLGLPITKTLAELHGGRLLLESEPGRGTVATVVFPASRIYHTEKMENLRQSA